MFKLGLLFIPAFFILVGLTFSAIQLGVGAGTGFSRTVEVHPLLWQACFMLPNLILIRFLIFIPTLIIVLDCRVLESFKYLKQCKLSEAKELVIMFLVSMVLSFCWVLISKPDEAQTFSSEVIRIVFSIVTQTIGLITGVLAVRYIASLGLTRTTQPELLNPKDLLRD